MTTEELNKEISELWYSMETKQDLLKLLNLANQGIYGDKAKPYSLRQLTFQAYSKFNKSRYASFKIPKKKKGEFRTIDAPNPTLKGMQRALNYVLQVIYTPSQAAMGFTPGRSIVTGAQVHIGQKFVYNIDLENFFPSIKSGRVFARMQSKPFSCSKEVASLIADLCCYENSFGKVLPQGAPSSPTLTNIICDRLDVKLSHLAKAYGLRYTRYADDITFSGMSNMFAENGNFCKSLRNIIENEEHFKINTQKTRLCHRGIRQEVTGITVNDKPNVTQDYVKQIRSMLHNWETKGYDEAQSIFIEIYNRTNTKHHNAKGAHHIENILAGKLLYLKMVKGENDGTYKKLYDRFVKLITKTDSPEPDKTKGIPTNNSKTTNNPKQNTESLIDDLNNSLDAIINSHG